MSKPDKHGDEFERDAREDFPELKERSSKGSGKEDGHSCPSSDEFDDLESSDELLGAGTGMSKEIKIGLAVIAALLVVLAVVIVAQITRSSEETASGGPDAANHEDHHRPGAKAAPIFGAAASGARSRSESDSGFPRIEKKQRPDDGFTFASDDRKGPRPDKAVRAEVGDRERGSASGGWGGSPDSRADTRPSDVAAGSVDPHRTKGPDDRRRTPGGIGVTPGGTGVSPAFASTGVAPVNPESTATMPVPPVPSGSWSLTDEPPRVGPPAGQPPVRSSAGSYASSTDNPMRDRPALGERRSDGAHPGSGGRPAGSARSGEPYGDGGFGSEPTRRTGVSAPLGTPSAPLGTPSAPLGTPPAPPFTQSAPLYTQSAPLSTQSAGPGTAGKRDDDPFHRDAGSRGSPRDLASSPRDLPPSQPSQPMWDSSGTGLSPNSNSTGVAPLYGGITGNVAGPRGATAGERVYVVQPGDTVYDIARNELGSALRWNDIYQLNRDQLAAQPDSLAPGTRLLLPQDAGAGGVLTQRPASGYVR